MMFEIKNTTDIPTQSIFAAALFGAEDKRLYEWVKEITVRNKTHGILHGRFGVYRGWDKRIIITVPPEMPDVWHMKLQYCGWRIFIRNRTELLVAVLAHEFRHAYYHMTGNILHTHYERDNSIRKAAEINCEVYEERKLVEYQRIVDGNVKAAHSGR